MVGKIVRVTSPSRSSPRTVRVSMRWEMPSTERRSSPKRLAPSPRTPTTSTLHLSPTRLRTSRTARHFSSVVSMCFGDMDVPPCASATSYLYGNGSYKEPEPKGEPSDHQRRALPRRDRKSTLLAHLHRGRLRPLLVRDHRLRRRAGRTARGPRRAGLGDHRPRGR